MKLSDLIKISRPRFWIYLAGPYLVGYIFATKNIYSLSNPYFLINFLYFLFPANLLVYGINDFFDHDTDVHNPKKNNILEHKLLSKEKNQLIGILLLCLALTFFLLALQTQIETQLLFTAFLFLSYFYSAPPLRLKAKPFLDFSSNILYVLPALIAFYQYTSTFPPLEIIIALFTWTFAMHLFSAIPDITPDKNAKIETSAVFFGENTSLIFCLIFWLITASIFIYSYPSLLSLISLVYPLIPLLLIIDKKQKIEKVYWYFPYINTFSGFILFLIALYQ